MPYVSLVHSLNLNRVNFQEFDRGGLASQRLRSVAYSFSLRRERYFGRFSIQKQNKSLKQIQKLHDCVNGSELITCRPTPSFVFVFSVGLPDFGFSVLGLVSLKVYVTCAASSV